MISKKTKIGFIGTGIMGLPMAKNLIKSKYDVYSYVRNKNNHSFIKKNRIKIIHSIDDFYSEIDILILVVSETIDVKQLLIGKDGLIAKKNKPSIIIDMSTICPIETINISKVLQKNKISLIDAPVSGGEIGAIEGKLSIMIGGKKNIVTKIMPIFRILGEKITHIGESGSGQVAKACNQIIVAQTVHAISEAFIIADKFKVNKKNVREALLGGFAKSKALETHGERILNKNYKPGFKTKLHAKDLRIARGISVKKKLNLKGTNLVTQYMNECNKNGHSEKDSSSYYLTVKEKNK
tara:strand:- start:8254 stop:9138 length:885 start_codon:yes stop_codon:yes gene_type:complete